MLFYLEVVEFTESIEELDDEAAGELWEGGGESGIGDV